MCNPMHPDLRMQCSGGISRVVVPGQVALEYVCMCIPNINGTLAVNFTLVVDFID